MGSGPSVALAVPNAGRVYIGHIDASRVYIIRDTATAIAETPERKRAKPQRPTLMTRVQLQAELHFDPSLSLFDAAGRQVHNPRPGVYFISTPHPSLSPQGARVRKILLTH